MPGELVKRLSLRVQLPRHDLAMLVPCDGALVFESHGGPLAFGNERPRQPVHVHAEVVQTPEINIGRNGSDLQSFQQRLAFGFDDDLRQQRNQRAVFDDAQPAFLVRVLLGVGQRFDGVLPGARGDAVVAAGEIRLGDLQIQHRLAFRVVPGLDDLLGVVRVGGAEAGAFAGLGVHTVVSATTISAADETVTCFHSLSRNREDKRGRLRTVSE